MLATISGDEPAASRIETTSSSSPSVSIFGYMTVAAPASPAIGDDARPLDGLSLDEQDRLLSQGWRGRLTPSGCVLVLPEVVE